MQKDFGQWRFEFTAGLDFARYQCGWRMLRIGFYRIEQWPKPGNKLVAGKNYRGFRFAISYWLPWELIQWR